MVTKQRLIDLQDGNRLKTYVIDYLIKYYRMEEVPPFFQRLFRDHASSGMVNGLKYAMETDIFYTRFKREIDHLALIKAKELGYKDHHTFYELIESQASAEDIDSYSIRAWFGFEETARKLYDEIFGK